MKKKKSHKKLEVYFFFKRKGSLMVGTNSVLFGLEYVR